MAEDSKIANLDDANSTKNALLKAAGIPKGLREKFNDRVLANFDSQMENLVSTPRNPNSHPAADEEVGSDDDTYSIGSDELPNENSSMSTMDSIPSDACLKKLMAEGKDLTQITEEGECLLSLASANGYLDLVQVMLAMNRDSVDERGPKNDLTPLMESVVNGHEDCAKVLIEHGANINAQSENGNTPLHYACANGHVSIAKELLERGAGIEDQNENGHTPLMEAASNGLVDIARILLERGAGINAYSSEFKESALTLACYKGHYEMVKFLLEEGADQDHQTEEMHTALMEACMDGHYDVAKLLIDHGAKVNMPTESFESPLTLAACGGHLQLANLLIEKGASLEEVNDEGYSPLMEAAREGHEAMVMLLVNCGANVNAQTEETQETALTLACYNGFINIAKFLLGTAGADVNGGGSSPLMEAAHQGHVDLVKFLINSGADLHLETGGGDTALSFACENGHNEVAEILLNCGAKLEHESEGGRTPLMKAARAGHVCTVQFLVSRGADVNRLSQNEDHTPLSLACSGDHKNVVELLLEHGADPSVRLKDGSNALIEATKAGNTQIVRLLLEYSPSITDSLTDTNELIYGSEIQPRVPTQALPNMVPPAQQNPMSLNVATQKTNMIPCQVHNYNCPRNANNQMLQQSQIPDVVQSTQESFVVSGPQQQQYTNNPHVAGHAQVPAHVCDHLRLAQGGTMYPFDDNSYHEKEQEIAKNLQKERDELLKKKAKLMSEKKEISKNVQQAAKQYREQQLQHHQHHAHQQQQQQQTNSSKLAPDCQNQLWHQMPAMPSHLPPHDCLDPSSQCNQQTPTSEASGQHCSETSFETLSTSGNSGPCCEHHTLPTACGDVKTGSQSQPGPSPYLEEGFSAANPLAGCNLQKNVGIPKVDNSKQCLINNLNRPPGSGGGGEIGNEGNSYANRQVSVLNPQLVNHPALSGLGFDGSLENFDVGNFPLSMVPQYPMNNVTGIDSAILEKLKQLPETEQRKLIELTTTLASAIDNPHLLQYVSQQSPQNTTSQQQQQSGSQSSSKSPSSQVSPTTATTSAPQTPTIQQQQQAIATTFAAAIAASQSSNILSPESLASTFSMENVLNAAGLIAAVNADPSQRVFDLLNQGYSGDKMIADQQLAAQFGRMDLEPDQQETSQTGDLLLAPNPSPTEGIGTPNRSTSPCENVPSSYMFRPGDLYPVGATPAGILPTGVIPSFQGLTAEQIMALNGQTASNGTQTASIAGQPVIMPQALNQQQQVALALNNGVPTMAMGGRTTVEVNAQTDSNNDTPLTIAAAAGNRDIVRELLKSKADIEHKDKKGFTPLILAASGGHVDVVRLLLETEAQLEATSERTKDTALSLACSGGKEDVVCVLLEKGANIEHRNVSDYTPLSLAASGGYIKIIKMLLSAGAEINSRTGSRLGISPLMLAAMNGHGEAVKLLLDHGSDINAQIESNRNTALTLACYQGRHEVVSLLLERRANMEHRAKSGLTPLMEAASGGYADVGRVLLDHGADVNAPPVPASRDTALTIAADKGHYNFCEVVVARGANVEARNKKGGTPLWLACNGGHLDVAMMLVTSGADVDAQDNRKISCLMAAFRRGHVKVLRYLVKKVSQFPGNQECLRYIATLSDNDLIKRCNQCLDIISNAKDKQAEQANKNATSLLQELDDEKCREEKQKEAAARKREKRRLKKKQQKTNSNSNNDADKDGNESQDEDGMANDKDEEATDRKAEKSQQLSGSGKIGGGSMPSSAAGGIAGRKILKAQSSMSNGVVEDTSKDGGDADDETDYDALLGMVDSVSLSSSGNSSTQTSMLIRSSNNATQAASSVNSNNHNNSSSSVASGNSSKKKNKKESSVVAQSAAGTPYSPRRAKNKTAHHQVTSSNNKNNNNNAVPSTHAKMQRENSSSSSANTRSGKNAGGNWKSKSSASSRSVSGSGVGGNQSSKKQVMGSSHGQNSMCGSMDISGGREDKTRSGSTSGSKSSSQCHSDVVISNGPQTSTPSSSAGGRISPFPSTLKPHPFNTNISNATSSQHQQYYYNMHYTVSSGSYSRGTVSTFTQSAKNQDAQNMNKVAVPLNVNLSPTNGEVMPPTSGSNSSSGYLSVTPTRNGSSNVSPRKPARRGEEGWKEVTVSRKSLISKKTVVPGSAISRVIGRQGCNINAIREATCAHIEIDKQSGNGGAHSSGSSKADRQLERERERGNNSDRIVNIRGSAESVKWAEKLIDILIQDPTVDITEHIPKNLAQTLTHSNNQNLNPQGSLSSVSSSGGVMGHFTSSAPGAKKTSQNGSIVGGHVNSFGQPVSSSNPILSGAPLTTGNYSSFGPSNKSGSQMSGAPAVIAMEASRGNGGAGKTHYPSVGVIGSRPVGSRSSFSQGSSQNKNQTAWKTGDGSMENNAGNYNAFSSIFNQGSAAKIWQGYLDSNVETGDGRGYGGFQGQFDSRGHHSDSNLKSSDSRMTSSAVGGPSSSNKQQSSNNSQPGSLVGGSNMSHSVNIPLDTLFNNNSSLNPPESDPSSLFSSVNSQSPESSQSMTALSNNPTGPASLNVSLNYPNTTPTGRPEKSRNPSGNSVHAAGDVASPKVSPPLSSSQASTSQSQSAPGGHVVSYNSGAQKDISASSSGLLSDSSAHIPTSQNQPGGQQSSVGSEKKHGPAPIGFERKAPAAKSAHGGGIQSQGNLGFSGLTSGNNQHLGPMYSSLESNHTPDLFNSFSNFNMDKSSQQFLNSFTTPHAQNPMTQPSQQQHHQLPNFYNQHPSNAPSFYPQPSSGVQPSNDLQQNPSVSMGGGQQQQMSNVDPTAVGGMGGGMMRHEGGAGNMSAGVSGVQGGGGASMHSHSIQNMYSSQQNMNGNLSVSQQMVASGNSQHMGALAPGSMNQFRVNPNQFFNPINPQSGNLSQQQMLPSHHSAMSNPNGPQPSMVNPMGSMHNGGFLPFGASNGNSSNMNMNNALGLNSASSGRGDLQSYAAGAQGGFAPFLSNGVGMDCDRGVMMDERSLNLNLAAQHQFAHNGADTMFSWGQSGVGNGDYNQM